MGVSWLESRGNTYHGFLTHTMTVRQQPVPASQGTLVGECQVGGCGLIVTLNNYSTRCLVCNSGVEVVCIFL